MIYVDKHAQYVSQYNERISFWLICKPKEYDMNRHYDWLCYLLNMGKMEYNAQSNFRSAKNEIYS